MLRNEALPAARLLQERFGTPYVYGAPYGYEGTGCWLEEISQAVGIPMSDEVRRALRERKKESMTYRMYAGMYRDRPHPPTAALAGDYDTLVGLAGVCRELDIPTDLMICAHSLKDVEEPMEGITHFPRERDQIDALRALDYHLVLADDVSLHLCDETNVGRCVSFPLVHRTQIARHLPLMGLRGMDDLLETVSRYYDCLDG